MGCVLPAGVGQAPARQAAHLRRAAQGGAVHDGQQGVRLGPEGGDARRAGDRRAARPTWSSPAAWSRCRTRRTTCRRRARGMRMGNQTVVDGMIHDGLWDSYNNFHMGNAAELCAREKKIDRARAGRATPPSPTGARSRRRSRARSRPRSSPSRCRSAEGRAQARRASTRSRARGDIEKLPSLRPRSRRTARSPPATRRRSTTAPRRWCCAARDVARSARLQAARAHPRRSAQAAQAPEWFTTAPALAIEHALAQGEARDATTIDLCEINEAFAVVSHRQQPAARARPDARSTSTAARSRSAIPIGASGARILTTLLYALAAQGAKRGVRVAVHRRRRRHRAAGRALRDGASTARLGVIGAGQMGSGIAQVAAQAGSTWCSSTRSRDCAETGKRKIDAALDKLVQKGKLKPEERAAALARIAPADGYAGVRRLRPRRRGGDRERGAEEEDLRRARRGGASRARSWRRTPRRSRSRCSARRPGGRSRSSGCTS